MKRKTQSNYFGWEIVWWRSLSPRYATLKDETVCGWPQVGSVQSGELWLWHIWKSSKKNRRAKVLLIFQLCCLSPHKVPVAHNNKHSVVRYITRWAKALLQNTGRTNDPFWNMLLLWYKAPAWAANPNHTNNFKVSTQTWHVSHLLTFLWPKSVGQGWRPYLGEKSNAAYCT